MVGFVGLGTMGSHMASSLLRAGLRLVVCDTNDAAVDRLRAQGASVSGTPAQLAATPGKAHSLQCPVHWSILDICSRVRYQTAWR